MEQEDKSDSSDTEGAFWTEQPGTSNKVNSKQECDIASYLSKDFIKTTAHCYYCSLCNTIVPKDEESLIEHMNDKEHRMYEENFIKIKSFSYHCTVCDVKFAKTDVLLNEHLRDERHESAVLSVKPSDVLDRTDESENICESKETLNKELKSEKKDSTVQSSKKSVQITNNQTIQTIDNPLIVGPLNYICALCNVEVQKSEKAWNQHVSSYTHRTNEFQREHSRPVPRSSLVYNNASQVMTYQPFRAFTPQATGTYMSRTYPFNYNKTTQILNNPIMVTPLNYICVLCNVELPKSDITWNQHLSSYNHRTTKEYYSSKIFQKEHSRSGSSRVNGPEKQSGTNPINETTQIIDNPIIVGPHNYICVFCNVEVPKSEKRWNQHLSSYNHRTNKEHYSNKVLQKEHSIFVDDLLFKNGSESQTNYNKTTQILDNPIKVGLLNYICVLCNVEVPKSEKARNQHLSSYIHRINKEHYTSKISHKEQSISVAESSFKSESSQDTCKEPDVSMKDLDHKTVENNISKVFPEANCTETSVTRSKDSNIKTNLNESTKNNICEQWFIKDEGSHYYCSLCNKNVPPIEKNLTQHLSGKYHTRKAIEIAEETTQDSSVQTNHVEMQTYQKVVLEDKGTHLYCVLCGTKIPRHGNLLDERLKNIFCCRYTNKLISKEEGFENIDESAPYFSCKLCNVTISKNVDEILKHIEEHNHEEYYEEKHIEVKSASYFCRICCVHLRKSYITVNKHLHAQKHQLYAGFYRRKKVDPDPSKIIPDESKKEDLRCKGMGSGSKVKEGLPAKDIDINASTSTDVNTGRKTPEASSSACNLSPSEDIQDLCNLICKKIETLESTKDKPCVIL